MFSLLKNGGCDVSDVLTVPIVRQFPLLNDLDAWWSVYCGSHAAVGPFFMANTKITPRSRKTPFGPIEIAQMRLDFQRFAARLDDLDAQNVLA